MGTSDKLSEWITEELNTRGWSIRELARRAELSHATINGVLSGTANPGLDFCKGVARALHVAPEDVIRKAGLLPYIPPDVHQSDELLHYFTQLPNEDRQRIITLPFGIKQGGSKYKTEDQ